MSAAQVPARVAAFLRKSALLEPGEPVLVATSGGADSTALALALHALDVPIQLAHVDHGWRGTDGSAAERDAVQTLAGHLDVPAHFVARDATVSRTENAARQWRYRALAEVLRRTGLRTLATGHHRGDQAETLLMRLLRGSGPWGLAGIPPARGLQGDRYRVVRPLLQEDPATLRAYVRAHGLAWVEDPSNADPGFERVRARARLADVPEAVESLARVAERLRERVAARDAALRESLAGRMDLRPFAHAVSVPRDVVREQRGYWMDQLLRLLGRPLHADRHGPWLTRRHVRLASEIARTGGGLDLPRDLHWHVAGGRAWLWRRDPSPPALSLEQRAEPCGELASVLASRGPDEALLDAAVVASPALRLLRPDDTFAPFGRNQPRTARVTDWLKRRGIPRVIRQRQWVVAGSRGVAWVVGQRIDRNAALTSRTQRLWRVRVACATVPCVETSA